MEDLILDFNLYLCEKFGYRESCSVMPHANGFCMDIRERDLVENSLIFAPFRPL